MADRFYRSSEQDRCHPCQEHVGIGSWPSRLLDSSASRCGSNVCFSTLASRLQVDASDLGLLSTRLIEEAAAGFDVSPDLLISQQAEAVAEKYLEE